MPCVIVRGTKMWRNVGKRGRFKMGGKTGWEFCFGDLDEKGARDPVIIYAVKMSRRKGALG